MGYVLARTTGSWVCSRNIPLNVVWFGADASGAADSTTAIQAAMNAASTIGACVYVPNGTYLVSTVTWPGFSSTTYPYFARPCLFGDGPGSRLLQVSSSKSTNTLVIGNGVLNDNGDGYIRDIAIESQVKKNSGAYIFAKGAARLKLQNIYMEDSNAWNCVVVDGVDFHIFSNLKCYTPGGDAIYAYDGYDCGYSPVSKNTNGSTSSGGNVIYLSNTSGILVGMSVYDINAGPNTAFSGTVQSIVANKSVTMTGSWSYPNPIAPGDTLVFGSSCGGTGLVIDGDTTLVGGARYGVTLSGGLGGVYFHSFHAYSFVSHAVYIDTYSANGIPNREIFFGQFTDIDSNKGDGIYVNNNSFGVLQINGAWVGASGSDAIFIAQQRATQNPVDTGSLVYIANSRISQSNGSCLRYADTGTLVLTGNVMSWCYGSGGDGLSITSNDNRPKITATGNVFQSNNHYGVYIYGTAPASMVWVGNQWNGNSGGAQAGIVPSANVSCTGNVGSGTGC